MEVWVVMHENDVTGRKELYDIYDNKEAALEYARYHLCGTFNCTGDGIAEQEWHDGSVELRTVEFAPFVYLVRRWKVGTAWKAELGEIPF